MEKPSGEATDSSGPIQAFPELPSKGSKGETSSSAVPVENGKNSVGLTENGKSSVVSDAIDRDSELKTSKAPTVKDGEDGQDKTDAIQTTGGDGSKLILHSLRQNYQN